MMETLSQTFVVAPSFHRQSQHVEEEEEEEEEFEYVEDDDDSASFYDEDQHYVDMEEDDDVSDEESEEDEEEEEEEEFEEEEEEEDDDDDSEGSLEQGGNFFGTAKYFGGLAPQMMGFSDSFVTDGEGSDTASLCETEFAVSPSASPHASGSNWSPNQETMEESIHEDVLSFDMMLGKKQMSQSSLSNTLENLNHPQPEQLLVVHQPRNSTSSSHSKRSSTKGDRSRSTSRSRSRSASTSRRRRRSTSRSSDAPQPELPPTLMPMSSQEDEEEEVEDMFSILAVASVAKPKTTPQKQPQQHTGTTGERRRKSSKHTSSSRDKSGRKGRSSHRRKEDSEHSKQHHQQPQKRTSLAHSVDSEPIPRRSMEGSSRRRGSIQARRQSHRMGDTSNATNNSNNSRTRRPSMALDPSAGEVAAMEASNNNQQPRLQRVDSRGKQAPLRRVDSRENAAAARRASINTPGVGGAAQRRRGSYRGLMSPEVIAQQLKAEEEEEWAPDPEVANGLRKSQSRNTRLGRRRSTTADAGISKSEVVKSSRRPSEAGALSRSATTSGSRRQLQKSGDSQQQLSHRQLALQRHASVTTVSTHEGTVSTHDSTSTENSNNDHHKGRSASSKDLMATSPANVGKAIRRMPKNGTTTSGSARDVTATSPGIAGTKALRRGMSSRDRIRRHLSCEANIPANAAAAAAAGMESSGNSLEDEGSSPTAEVGVMTRQDSRRERRKSFLKGQRNRKVTRCRSEPTERMHDIMHADIDDDTVAAMDYIEGEEVFDDEEDVEEHHHHLPTSVHVGRQMERSNSVKNSTKKALKRSEAATTAKKATATATANILKF